MSDSLAKQHVWRDTDAVPERAHVARSAEMGVAIGPLELVSSNSMLPVAPNAGQFGKLAPLGSPPRAKLPQ
jgi:hypothetical protein